MNKISVHSIDSPWGASLNPCTNLAEFSLKNRWRYMMRTSAWQLRFRTSTESAISRESASAASRPRWSSLSREKSWRRREGDSHSHTELGLLGAWIYDDMGTRLCAYLVSQCWGQRVVSKKQSLGNLETSTTFAFGASYNTHTHTSSFTGFLCGNIVNLKLQTSQVTKACPCHNSYHKNDTGYVFWWTGSRILSAKISAQVSTKLQYRYSKY